MKKISFLAVLLSLSLFRVAADQDLPATAGSFGLASKNLGSGTGALAFNGFFYETAKGRMPIPLSLGEIRRPTEKEIKMPDGRTVKVSVTPGGDNFEVSFSAKPDADISKWGLAIKAAASEYFTGLME